MMRRARRFSWNTRGTERRSKSIRWRSAASAMRRLPRDPAERGAFLIFPRFSKAFGMTTQGKQRALGGQHKTPAPPVSTTFAFFLARVSEWSERAFSAAIRACFRLIPQAYPPRFPSLRITRWQGMAIATGLLAQALPTARTAAGWPIATATWL